MSEAASELLSDARILAAALIFFGSYVVFALGKFPGMKIDRPGAAIIGAVLMVAFGIVNANTALAAVDFATIVLLFSMMLTVSHVRAAGFFDVITAWVLRWFKPRHLLPAVIFTTGALSAFMVNDIVCLVMAPLVIHLARRFSLPPLAYVLAVATSANIGSVATPTGNPQNMLIGSLSQIPYTEFLLRLGPIALLGLLANWGIIHVIYRRRLTDVIERPPQDAGPPARLTRLKPIVVLAGVLGAFFAGVPPALAAAVGAAVLLITRSVDPQRAYRDVDWGLLVFFVGLFVIVAGAERAGLTASLLSPLTSWGLDRLPLFVAVTATLSNVVSNVPAVMLLRGMVPGLADPHGGWLALAMASTLAGNLTVTGSVANIIVVERASAEGVTVTFRDYVEVGLPLTIATLVIGTLWLWAT
jgi:Na+/H+ antiporter NhaD/arsenite permease-like protein